MTLIVWQTMNMIRWQWLGWVIAPLTFLLHRIFSSEGEWAEWSNLRKNTHSWYFINKQNPRGVFWSSLEFSLSLPLSLSLDMNNFVPAPKQSLLGINLKKKSSQKVFSLIKRHYVPESNDHHDNCVKQRICYNLVNGNAKPDDGHHGNAFRNK